jgi:hypothetical protein
MLTFVEVSDFLIMATPLDDTSPDSPQPTTQQGSAPQRVNGDVIKHRQPETSVAPGSQNSAASNGASTPSYSLADLGLRDSNSAPNDTHTKNSA